MGWCHHLHTSLACDQMRVNQRQMQCNTLSDPCIVQHLCTVIACSLLIATPHPDTDSLLH